MAILESAIAFVSPAWAAQRAAARVALDAMASYNGAIRTRADTIWPATGGNPVLNNSLACGNLKLLRDRSQNLVENNSIAAGMLDRCVDNIIGSGIGLQVQTADPAWNKKAEELFKTWFDTADIGGNSWIELQRLMCISWLRDGDVGAVLLKDGRIQPIEGASIVTPAGKAADATIVDGVQLNANGRPVGFHIASWEGWAKYSTTRVDANDFIFLARKKRFSQVRGEPCFAPCFRVFDQLDQWQNAVLQNAKIAAYFALVINKQNPADLLGKARRTPATQAGGQPGTPATPGIYGNPATPGARQLTFEPGSINVMQPGETITTIDAKQPGPAFEPNFVLNVRTLGLVLGLPLELVLLDFSKTNFSSARASLLQAYRSFKAMQAIYIGRFLSRLYRWRVSKFINEGLLSARPDAFNHRWIPQPWPFLDPIREAQALQMQIDIGTESLTSALLAQGHDFDVWLNTRAAELAAMKAKGITPMHSASMQSFGADAVQATEPIDPNAPIYDEESNNE